jgi:hypothetical protein
MIVAHAAQANMRDAQLVAGSGLAVQRRQNGEACGAYSHCFNEFSPAEMVAHTNVLEIRKMKISLNLRKKWLGSFFIRDKSAILLKVNICYQTIFFFVTFCGKSNQKPPENEYPTFSGRFSDVAFALL